VASCLSAFFGALTVARYQQQETGTVRFIHLQHAARQRRMRIIAMAAFVLLAATALYAKAPEGDDAVGVLTVEVNHSAVLTPPWPVARVSVINPAVADVLVLSPERVLVLGTAVGMTDLILWSESEESWQRRVNVIIDLEFLQRELESMFPTAKLEVVQSRQALAVRGTLRRAEDAAHLQMFLTAHGVEYVDMTSVAGVQQVLLQVRIAEVSRSAVRAMGINFLHAGNDFFGANVLGSSAGPLNPVQIGVPEGALAAHGLPFHFLTDTVVSPAVTVFGGVPRADFQFFIQALAENQYLRVLAEPNLVALSGEQASFLAGGEFPIPVVQSGIGEAASISIEYREFGVQLSFKPLVLGDGTIRLWVAPEVSDLSDVGAVEIQGFRVPGVLTRRAETTLELSSGQSFAMAGLLNTRVDARVSRVPLLGNLPVLGPLFRSVRYAEGDTELAVLVTASLVEPTSETPMPMPGVLHMRPSDWELYAKGRLQGEGPAKISPADAEYLRELGLHRLKGPGAWVSYGSPEVKSQATSRRRAVTHDTERKELDSSHE
jgi:pilus assembly protein CpaC